MAALQGDAEDAVRRRGRVKKALALQIVSSISVILSISFLAELGIAFEHSSADQLLKKIARKKAILIFSAILAKRGNLNLDLNLDLQCAKFQGILMFYTRGS